MNVQIYLFFVSEYLHVTALGFTDSFLKNAKIILIAKLRV